MPRYQMQQNKGLQGLSTVDRDYKSASKRNLPNFRAIQKVWSQVDGYFNTGTYNQWVWSMNWEDFLI